MIFSHFQSQILETIDLTVDYHANEIEIHVKWSARKEARKWTLDYLDAECTLPNSSPTFYLCSSSIHSAVNPSFYSYWFVLESCFYRRLFSHLVDAEDQAILLVCLADGRVLALAESMKTVESTSLIWYSSSSSSALLVLGVDYDLNSNLLDAVLASTNVPAIGTKTIVNHLLICEPIGSVLILNANSLRRILLDNTIRSACLYANQFLYITRNEIRSISISALLKSSKEEMLSQSKVLRLGHFDRLLVGKYLRRHASPANLRSFQMDKRSFSTIRMAPSNAWKRYSPARRHLLLAARRSAIRRRNSPDWPAVSLTSKRMPRSCNAGWPKSRPSTSWSSAVLYNSSISSGNCFSPKGNREHFKPVTSFWFFSVNSPPLRDEPFNWSPTISGSSRCSRPSLGAISVNRCSCFDTRVNVIRNWEWSRSFCPSVNINERRNYPWNLFSQRNVHRWRNNRLSARSSTICCSLFVKKQPWTTKVTMPILSFVADLFFLLPRWRKEPSSSTTNEHRSNADCGDRIQTAGDESGHGCRSSGRDEHSNRSLQRLSSPIDARLFSIMWSEWTIDEEILFTGRFSSSIATRKSTTNISSSRAIWAN